MHATAGRKNKKPLSKAENEKAFICEKKES